jgi:hypothetical protein
MRQNGLRATVTPGLSRAQRKALESEEGTSAAQAFQLLVDCDVLIMSRSAFSYLAALYSTGMKCFPPEMWLEVPMWCDEERFTAEENQEEVPRNDLWARIVDENGTAKIASEWQEEVRERLATFL